MIPGKPIDNTTMVIKVAGHEYCVTNKPKRHSKSLSLGSISDIGIEVEKTKMERTYTSSNNYCETMGCKNIIQSDNQSKSDKDNVYNNDKESTIVDLVGVKRSETKEAHEKNFNKIAKSIKDSTQEHQQRKVLNKQTSINNKKSSNDHIVEVQNSSHRLSKSKSEGNPFQHRKKGKVVRVNRPVTRGKKTFVAWSDV